MSRKNQAAAAAAPAPAPAAQVVESTDEAQKQGADAGVTEATESEQPAGVVTTEGLPPEADPEQRTDKGSVADPLTDADAAADLAGTPRPSSQAPAYVVVSHVKAGGKRYAPGDPIPAEHVADTFLASGAVVKA